MKSILDRLLGNLPRYDDPEAPHAGLKAQRQGWPEALDRLLATLQVAVRSMAICETVAGKTLVLHPAPHPLIHYVLKGSGSLLLDGGEAIAFVPHTFIVLPSGTAHSIGAAGDGAEPGRTGGSVAMVDHMLKVSADPSRPAEVVLTCGTVEASFGGAIGMFEFVERPLAFALDPEDRLRKAFEALLEELAEPRLGSRILTEALLKQCLVLLIRRAAPDPLMAGWLFGSMDPRLAEAVLRLFEEPAHPFTLDELARGSGMSRSAFAARFQAAFGTTPIDLLKRIRLHHAAELLTRSELPIAMIARSVGYESRTYFSRAFRAEFGVDPSGFRSRKQR